MLYVPDVPVTAIVLNAALPAESYTETPTIKLAPPAPVVVSVNVPFIVTVAPLT